MKQKIKESLTQLISDRYLVILLSGMLLFAIISAIVIGFSIRPSEIQLVSHYTSFGISHYYRDQWYYLFTFVGFVIVVFLIHFALSIKMLVLRGHSAALMFAWSGVGIIALCLVMALSLINSWNP
jgi:ABC-type enterochelin transport system permease subunit